METKIGVVLSGGGAKGAYEVGLLKALAEFGIEPDVIAGTSIGALNGSVCASWKDIKQVAKITEEVWLSMVDEIVFKLDDEELQAIEAYKEKKIDSSQLAKFSIDNRKKTKIIKDILQEYSPIEKLKSGLPFYIGMTQSGGFMKDLTRFFSDKFPQQADFFKIQSLKVEDMHNAILASAALPILFDGVEINGTIYRDGCLGSRENSQGNTPVSPLVDIEKCTHLIVCHLDNDTLFNRYKYKKVRIIEIKPTKETFESGLDALKFDNQYKIKSWISQGYKDTKKELGVCLDVLKGQYLKEHMDIKSEESIKKLENDGFCIPKSDV